MRDALIFTGWFAVLIAITVLIAVPLINLMITVADYIHRIASRPKNRDTD